MFSAIALPICMILFWVALTFGLRNPELEIRPIFFVAAVVFLGLAVMFALLLRKALATGLAGPFRKVYGIGLMLASVILALGIAYLDSSGLQLENMLLEGERSRLKEDQKAANDLRQGRENANNPALTGDLQTRYRQATAQAEQTARYVREREARISGIYASLVVLTIVAMAGFLSGWYLAFLSRPPAGLAPQGADASTLSAIAAWAMLIVGAVLTWQAAGLGVMAVLKGLEAFRSSSEPEPISAKELIARGAAGNDYVRVTRFVAAKNFVPVFDGDNPKDNQWAFVVVPLVAVEDKDNDAPVVAKARALAKIRVKNEAEYKTELAKQQVEGMVKEVPTNFGLLPSFPETNPANCILIEAGQTPYPRGSVYLMAGGAAVGILAGVALIHAGWKRRPRAVAPTRLDTGSPQ